MKILKLFEAPKYVPNIILVFFLKIAEFEATLFLYSLSANFTKWSNTLKQFVGNFPANCLSVFDHFAGLGLKGVIRTLSTEILEISVVIHIIRYFCFIRILDRSIF